MGSRRAPGRAGRRAVPGSGSIDTRGSRRSSHRGRLHVIRQQSPGIAETSKVGARFMLRPQ
jgi:hypothetical protein